MTNVLNQSEIKKILIDDVIACFGGYPMCFSTITLRLLMLAEKPHGQSFGEAITIPTKNYIAVYGAKNGNNSGAYLSIKKAVVDLKASNFFKSVFYANGAGKRATHTTIGFFDGQAQNLERFLKITSRAKLCDFSKLRSNHALRLYLFLNHLLKNLKPTHNGKVTIKLNTKEMRKFLSVPDEDYKVVGNLWSLVQRMCVQITEKTNIQVLESTVIGRTVDREIILTFGYKQNKD